MNTIDKALRANKKYAKVFNLAGLAMPPARRLAVVACMDARLTIEEMLGLKTGDVHIIRNAGGIVTEDVVRSLIISHYLLKTKEIMVINHTDCGMLTFKDDELTARLNKKFGPSNSGPGHFLAFHDIEDNVRAQIKRIDTHPWIPKNIPVRGFVFDVKTGKLNEVAD